MKKYKFLLIIILILPFIAPIILILLRNFTLIIINIPFIKGINDNFIIDEYLSINNYIETVIAFFNLIISSIISYNVYKITKINFIKKELSIITKIEHLLHVNFNEIIDYFKRINNEINKPKFKKSLLSEITILSTSEKNDLLELHDAIYKISKCFKNKENIDSLLNDFIKKYTMEQENIIIHNNKFKKIILKMNKYKKINIYM